MARQDLSCKLGPVELRSPLIAASGTVGSVWEWADSADLAPYGAAVAKSVSPEPWEGRQPPRLAPLATGMLNAIGIQNPGIKAWVEDVGPRIVGLDVPVWGSAVGVDPPGFARVARGLESAGVDVVEVNLSCPNIDNGAIFSFDPRLASSVVAAVRDAVTIPIGAKLSPDTPDIAGVAMAARDAGADFVVLTNTARGLGIDPETRRPLLGAVMGGFSGPGLKPISLRCVSEVATRLPGFPIVGCGGVMTGTDVVEYLIAGASAVAAGTVHLAEPKAGARIERELISLLNKLGVATPGDLVGTMETW